MGSTDASWLGERGKDVGHGILDGRAGFDVDARVHQPPTRQTVPDHARLGQAAGGACDGVRPPLGDLIKIPGWHLLHLLLQCMQDITQSVQVLAAKHGVAWFPYSQSKFSFAGRFLPR